VLFRTAKTALTIPVARGATSKTSAPAPRLQGAAQHPEISDQRSDRN
jgi:hypothetical protein